MQFPESWLRAFCNPPLTTQALADTLTMAGLEVEDARPVAPPFHGVVVAQVLAVARHPSADRLHVCQVDAGRGESLQIVCGAPNVRPGIKVPCALVGAELPPAEPGGTAWAIGLGQLRGVASQGMLCSARELKLSDEHAGLLILEPDARVGQDIREHLQLDDTVLTLKLTPNLGHCLSVYGVARELAALTGAPLLQPDIPPVPPAFDDKLPVRVEAPDLCGRFSGRILRGVDPRAATPAWMVDRLARCGQRSVSALVDISNYVMFEYGRPTHIFDLDKIREGLTVRWGRAGETLKLLSGATVDIDPRVGVIADAQGIESLAAIMGGDATAVGDDTRNVYVEAAFWWPEAIAGRSRRFNFTTDAGHRFERGVDPAGTVEHLERITRLIQDICGGTAGPVDDQVLALPPRRPVSLRVARAAKVLGMPVTQAQCEEAMRRLRLDYSSAPGVVTVVPPSWRFDLTVEEDLIEEVIRIIGYARLPETIPTGTLTPNVPSETRRGLDAVRQALAGLDYQETINYSFVEPRWEHELAGNPDPIQLVNPMASQWSVMRSSLLGSLIGVLRFNVARKAPRVRLFEIGRVFRRDPTVGDGAATVAGVDQPMHVAGLAYGSADGAQWGAPERAADFYDLKGDVETLLAPRTARFVADRHPALHPGRCARIEVDGVALGFIGELHPKWRQAYELPTAPLMFELAATAFQERSVPTHRPVQRQQSVWRDLSVIGGDALTHDVLMQTVAEAGAAGCVKSARLFDIYRPMGPSADIREGERSFSVRLELLDDETPLTEARIDATVAGVLAALTARLGVRLRA